MRVRRIELMIAAIFLAMPTQVALGQGIIVLNPSNVNPFSRAAINPYLGGPVGDPFDFRHQLMQQFGALQNQMANIPLAGQAGPPLNVQQWINQRESETRFSASGQPIGYSIYTPYYEVPNQNSFIPTATNRGRLR
jgi:hypothetical protein